jgi:flagellin
MAQVIGTNVSSISAQRQLNQTNTGLSTALERLSSGLRINSAKDDAAGIAIASRFTAQINGFNQGVRNAQDAISLAQTAEGAINELSTNVQRIRELAVQSANATNSDTDRSALQTEVAQLKAEIRRIVGGAEFNGKKILGSSAEQAQVFHVGANTTGDDTITVNLTNLSTNTALTALSGGNINTSATATTTIGQADALLTILNTERAKLGAVQNRFDSVVRAGEITVENLSASRSRIQDADFAKETANLTRFQILQQAGVSVLSQANALPQSVLGLLG